jgi:glycosyltransferase involved in cell wall biosynthesis
VSLFVRDLLADQVVLRGSAGPSAPLVSVILPTHQRRLSLQRAVESVLCQTFSDFEFLIVDDGSQDGSNDLIEDIRSDDPRVVHVRHQRNCGLPGLRVNEGIELARGQYLAFQFDDDYWRPNALAALVAAALRLPQPTVVVGHSRFQGKDQVWTLPEVPLNPVTMCEQNRFANNSVLMPRGLAQRYGMYDCHIGMRRLCDWDLWLRYIRYVPFAVIDEVIADVFESNPGSIGLTVPWDLPLFRYFHDIPRDHLLKPDCWRDYCVDGLHVGEVEFDKDFRRRLYEQHLVPYYLRFRHQLPGIEGFAYSLPPPRKSALLTRHAYDVSNDATLNHYDAICNRRGTYKAHFQPLTHIGPNWLQEADELLLIRTVEDAAKPLVKQSLERGVPVGLHLDDDLLHFHEYGAQYSYLSPGTPYHKNLCNILRRVDAVWVTSRFIAESVRPLTTRIVPHNNAVAAEWLPEDIRPRDERKPFRIGYFGSGYRLEEFQYLWTAFQQLSKELGDKLEFEFWGMDASSLPPLDSPVSWRPFSFSYFGCMNLLQDAGFDILLTPLLDQPRPRLAKSLIKYAETAVAGALGIFSDVPQYRSLPDGLTCLKAANTPQGWYDALHAAVTMPAAQFDLMRRRMLAHVREEFTEAAQIHLHEAAWRATEFHAKTRDDRGGDGRPRVMYVLHSAHYGGAEIQLWRRLRLAREYGVEPVVVIPSVLRETDTARQLQEALAKEDIQLEFVEYICFTEPRSPWEYRSDRERLDVSAVLDHVRPALVHTVTFIPSFGQVCQEMKIPHVATMYAVDDSFRWPPGQPAFWHCAVNQSDCLRYANRWGELLGSERFCARDMATQELFEVGLNRHLDAIGAEGPGARPPVRMVATGTFQKRKQQLETIEAVGQLVRQGADCRLDLYGYLQFNPEYVQCCRDRIRSLGVDDRIAIHDYTEGIAGVLKSADVLLSLSTYESFPGSVKDAMAAGLLVVATPVGGVAELIIDGVSGIVCSGTSTASLTEGVQRALSLAGPDRERMTEQARRVARSELHPQRAASDLFQMYNRAIDLTRGAAVAAAPAGVSTHHSSVNPRTGTVAHMLRRARLALIPQGCRRERAMRLAILAGRIARAQGLAETIRIVVCWTNRRLHRRLR